MVNNSPISIFISHSNNDNVIVGNLISAINDSYVELFLAHRDLTEAKNGKM